MSDTQPADRTDKLVYSHVCYEEIGDALNAFITWDGIADPPAGYTRYVR